MRRIKEEIEVFFTALMFYTRLPCPKWVGHSEEMLNKATRYFPLIGWVAGGMAAFVFWSSAHLFPISISVLLSMFTSILVTGAFHEDGWADVCDGFGGGWTKERILTIMKDSVIGAYGTVGLVFMLLTKFMLLWEIGSVADPLTVVYILVAAHSVSRMASMTMIYSHQYVRENEDSKAKPMAKQLPLTSLITGVFFGVIPMIFFHNLLILCLLAPVMGVKMYLGHYYKKWIGGYTGDCLGAVQQLTEVTFYLGFLALWKYI